MSSGRRSTRRVVVSGESQSQRGSSSRSQNKRQKLQEQSQNTQQTQQPAGFFDFPIVSWTQHEEDEMARKIKYYQDKFVLSCELNQHRRTNPEEEEFLTSTLLRFILFHNTKEPGIPITRQKIAEVIKEALPAGGAARGFLSTHVITRVQAELSSKMGLELKQIIPDKFILHSLLPRNILSEIVNDEKHDAMHGFILLVLAIIRLSNEKIENDDLWNKLGKFDVRKEDQIEGVGVAGAAVQLMVKKKYLKEEKQQTSDGFVVGRICNVKLWMMAFLVKAKKNGTES
eukprot:TRINITY_DN11384_c0_g1_i1.p2 TRINITY_DN11384_c0_g1~~TRINITY_DN11384_c0_g1_i1.p2  ORF type:complete len:286 (-),score=59.02 TRINITY_DN11384_c0_g1_i1:17-874(-)